MKRLIFPITILLIILLTTTLCGCDFITNIFDKILGGKEETPEITVTFDARGGGSFAPLKIKAGEKATSLPTPEKDHYDFGGWFKDIQCKNQYKGDVLSEDTTLYAKWTATLYTVNFDMKGGDSIADSVYSVEKPLSEVLEEITPTWHDTANQFLGWYTDSALTKVLDLDTVGYKNFTLYAKWQVIDLENSIKIHFSISEGSLSFSEVWIEKNSVLSKFPTASKEGYSIDGWYFDQDCTEKYENTALDGEITLYACWKINSYNFSVSNREDQGGRVNGSPNGVYTFGDSLSVSFIPNEGYIFEGWYIDGALVSTENPYYFTIPAKDVTITAKTLKDSIYKFDKAKGGDLQIENEGVISKVLGNKITSEDWTYSSTLKIKASYLNTLPTGNYEYMLIAGGECDYFTLSVYSSSCAPENLCFDYDRAYPEVKINFTCDCGGDHKVSVDGKALENYTDQSLSTFDKNSAHTLKVVCVNGGGQRTESFAKPNCDDSYLSNTFKVNGEIYDYYITTPEELGKAYQYLIFSPYSEDFGGYEGGASMKVAYGGEVKEYLEQNLTQKLLNLAMEDLVYSFSVRSGFSTLSGGDLMEIAIYYENLPKVEYVSGMEKETLHDERVLLTSGKRAESFNGFAITKFDKTQVINSVFALDELAYGVTPTFDSSPESLQAKAVYQKALSICRKYLDDSMSDFQKVTIIYDYLASIITYDDYALSIANLQNEVAQSLSLTDARNKIINALSPLSPLYSDLVAIYKLSSLSEIKTSLRAYITVGSYDPSLATTLNDLQSQVEGASTLADAKGYILQTIFQTAPGYEVVEKAINQSSIQDIYDELGVALKKMRSFTLEGALLDEIAVCDGIASAFKLLCHIEGIQCVEVSGYANEAHAWNKVFINGDWYLCDATWGRNGNYISHAYLFVNDMDMIKEGRQEQNSQGVHDIEILAKGEYDYFTQTVLTEGVDLFVTDSNSLAEVIAYYKNLGISTIEFACDKGYANVKNYIKNAMGKLGISGSYSIMKNNAETVFYLVLPY